MKLLLFALGICVGIVGFTNLAEAQNILGAHIMMASSVARIVGSQHFNNV
jgi:hypothetical protein